MILKAIAVLLLFCYSHATHLQYQQCILMDLDTENTLTFTDVDGNSQLNSSLQFDTADVESGRCYNPPKDMPRLILSWADAAVMRFDFANLTNDIVMLAWQLSYIPSDIFNTSLSDVVTHEVSFLAGHTDRAFTCKHQAPINNEVKVDNNTFKFEMTFTQAKWQAFNIRDGHYSSNVEDCEAPPSTAAPSTDPEVTLKGTDSGTTCILLKGKFLFTVTYPKTNRVIPMGSINVGVHNVASTKGNCGAIKTNELQVEFFEEGWKMVIVFGADTAPTLLTASDGGDDTFWWQQINLTYKYDEKLMPGLNLSFSGKPMTVSKTIDKQFKAPRDGSYKCNTEIEIDLSDGAKLKVSDMQYQAFQKNTTGFSSDKLSQCSADISSNILVPIAVGVVSAGLALLVILISRYHYRGSSPRPPSPSQGEEYVSLL